MAQKILDGIRVLDMTIYQLGPVNGAMLAAMGAEVIKIEPPVGDPGRTLGLPLLGSKGKIPYFPFMTAYFENCNRGKKGIVLDLNKPKAREILYQMVAKADVFTQNMRHGVAAKLGADYETLKKYNVKKIVTRIVRKEETEFIPSATFKDLKADSLDVVQILVAVEDTFDIEIQDEDLKNVANMEGFVAYIERKIAEKK